MREVISRAEPSDSPWTMTAFIAASLVLAGAGVGFATGIFAGFSTPILGLALVLAFASIATMALTYHRLFHEHRIVLEYDEDLW
ncbi:MAG: hypothetical protein ABEJ77_00450 [Halanaeroarchaeum sp.]